MTPFRHLLLASVVLGGPAWAGPGRPATAPADAAAGQRPSPVPRAAETGDQAPPSSAGQSSQGGQSGEAQSSARQAGQANDAQSLTSADIIVTGSGAATQTPVTASLTTTQPQSAVSRDYIDSAIAPTSDFNQIVAFTPGVTLSGNGNGPGLGETKVQIRGFQDGEYNVTYDSVPFADTNNPTHHSTAFFPSNTIETVVVDRGPGNASQLGQASYGGNLNIYSRAVNDEMGGQIEGTVGRFSTFLGRAEFQSGKIAALNDAQFVVAGQYLQSDGALTFEPVNSKNIFAKAVVPIGASTTLTLLSTYNQNFYFQSDTGVGTCGSADGQPFTGQISGSNCSASSTIGLYGKNFGLIGDPTITSIPQVGSATARLSYTQDYYRYNRTDKKTDFSIVRLQSRLAEGLVLDNRFYVYGYTNHTLSGQDASGRTANTVVTGFTTATVPVTATNPNGALTTAVSATGVPGYRKLNKYSVLGYIGQLHYDFGFGKLRAGGWYEHSATDRALIDIDLATGQPNYREAFNNGSGTAAAAALPATSIADTRYVQHSGWNQYQLFGEVDLRPFEALTVTPGVKYVHFTRSIDASVNQTSRTPAASQATWRKTLPFATANLALSSSWSAYGQYAQGIYVPDLSSFYSPSGSTAQQQQQATRLSQLKPQTSTNYQLGSVWHGRHISVDGDIYLIDVSNKIAASTVAGDPAGTLVNVGRVRYKGAEGEVSVVPLHGLTLIANGSANQSRNRATDRQIARAAYYTAGLGAFYVHGGLHLSYTQKVTGPQYANEYSGRPGERLYRIRPYSIGDLAISQEFGALRLGMTVDNVLNDRAITQISTSTVGAPTMAVNGVSYQSGYGQFDQLQYLPPTTFLVDARVRF